MSVWAWYFRRHKIDRMENLSFDEFVVVVNLFVVASRTCVYVMVLSNGDALQTLAHNWSSFGVVTQTQLCRLAYSTLIRIISIQLTSTIFILHLFHVFMIDIHLISSCQSYTINSFHLMQNWNVEHPIDTDTAMCVVRAQERSKASGGNEQCEKNRIYFYFLTILLLVFRVQCTKNVKYMGLHDFYAFEGKFVVLSSTATLDHWNRIWAIFIDL